MSRSNPIAKLISKRHASLICIQWINCISLVLSIIVMGLGFLLATKHEDCEKLMATPVLITGGFIMCVSIIGFLGALRQTSLLLWTYLFLMCLLLAALATFTLFAFVVTNHSKSRHKEEYKLQHYSDWLQNVLNKKENWERIRTCFVKPQICSELGLKYHTFAEYKHATLNPIESSCCRPPPECGFLARNATYYDVQAPPLTSHKDCKRYRNSIHIKCYDCDTCKGAVAHYLRKEWRVTALANIIIFTMLIVLYSIAYYARNYRVKEKLSSILESQKT